MDDLNKGKYIFVADFEYRPILYKLKANYPSSQWKVISKDELLDRLSFSFKKDPIPYLLTKGIDYSNAKKYLRLLRVSNYEKNEHLKEMYLDLEEKGYITFDEYGSLEIEKGTLCLFEMKEDLEIQKFLSRKGKGFEHLSLSDIGAKKNEVVPRIYSFPNKYIQYFHIYSEIRKTLLEDSTLKGRISVLINDESDLFYVNLASSLFDIPSYAVFLRPYLSDPKIKGKVSSIYKNKNFVFTPEEEKDPSLKELKGMVLYYGLDKLPFDFAYASLLDIANSMGIKERIDDKGITIENRYLINQSEKIYVTNFQYDSFYKVYDDKNVLTDDELEKIEANPSYIQTKMDRQKKLNYLFYNDIQMLSRVRQHLTDKIYDSQFLKELGWEKKVEKVKMNEGGTYTSKARLIYLADQLDKQFCSRGFEEISYKTYDHSFKGIKDREVIPPTRNWSVTNLESYIQCPFKYYLNYVIPSRDDDKHFMWLGTLNHKIMETILSDDFDYDKAFDEAVKEYKHSMERDGFEYGNKEDVWLAVVKHWLKKIVDSFRKAKDGDVIKLIKDGEIAEHQVSFTLTGSDGTTTYTFKNAKIDKILITESEGQRFYTIIDYKSGKENFEPMHVFLGPSTQLPMYYYAIENSEERDDLVQYSTFGGFGIIHTYSASPGDIVEKDDIVSDENAGSVIKMKKGLLRSQREYWDSIDEQWQKKDGTLKAYGGNYFSGYTFSQEDDNHSFLKDVKITPPYNVNHLVEDAKKALVDTIEKILRNDFPIKPTAMNLKPKRTTSLVCSRCPYGDICYKNGALDGVSYETLINEHFGLLDNKDDAGEEEEDDE